MRRILDYVESLSTAEFLAGSAAVLLAVDYALAPKGEAIVTQVWDKVSGHKAPALPPPPPPPPALHPGAPVHPAGAHAVGGLRGAGWGRGVSPYWSGPHNPGGPYPYWAPGSPAHAYAWE